MPYVTQSPDTTEAADRALFQMLRSAGPQRRLELARSHTGAAIRRAQKRIARRHPEWSELEVRLHWVELVYDTDIAHRLRKKLEKPAVSSNG